MKLKNIILCPSNLGQKKKGVEHFPELISKDIKSKFNINKLNLDNNIFKASHNIYKNCLNNKSICIGGDHSISIATGAASLNKYKNTKFIWIDAHADINTYRESKTKNYHGMPLAYLTGIDKNKSFQFIKNYLPLNNLYYIGLRDVDNFEKKILHKNNIQNIKYQSVNNNYLKIYHDLKKFINKNPVHISFDVDSIDPKFISSTGTIVKNGLNIHPAKKLLKLLIDNENVLCLDIVEMNMEINKHEYNKSLKNFKYIFSDIFKE